MGKPKTAAQQKAKSKTAKSTEPREYAVQYVITKRFVGGVPEYLTKWKMFSSRSNTWEPVESFKKCPWVIQEFEEINSKVVYPRLTEAEATY